MSACETMGNVTDICSDKTGTLTENSMSVIDIYYSGNLVSVTSGLNDKIKKDPELIDLVTGVAINCSATPDFSKSLKEQMGNKTEMALMEFSNNLGVNYSNVRKLENIINMIPFSSERKKMMTMFKQDDGRTILYVKGAPEIIL